MHHRLFIIILGIAFTALTVVMLCFPRSTFSELEKRDLASFPEFSIDKLVDNTYPGELSSWFSDSEPFRDEFMTLSMIVRDRLRLRTEESVTIHAPAGGGDGMVPGDDSGPDEDIDSLTGDTAVIPVNPLANEPAKTAAGIIIAGTGSGLRAMSAFGGEANGGGAYIELMNSLPQQLPDVRIYSLTVPLSTEFYCPDNARKATRPQKPFIDHVNSSLRGVTPVDAYGALAAHTLEPIYLRTDHHWAPLGAYYAAKAFAARAGVPFADISTYRADTIKRFVGSMYGYSHDISVKNSPEDFVYYTPADIQYTTTFVDYHVNKDFKITSASKPYNGSFFFKYKNGSPLAYNTFMGGDQKLTKVKTSTGGTRRLLIVKDSYGNALPGYLFGSFDEIHVVDFRYFRGNLRNYIAANGITDMLAAFNVFNAYSGAAARKIRRLMTQSGDEPLAAPAKPVETPAAPKAAKADSIAAPTEPEPAEAPVIQPEETAAEPSDSAIIKK